MKPLCYSVILFTESLNVHTFEKWPEKWWQKPLVNFNGKPLPAELVVLNLEVRPDEIGVWINSRKLTSGVADLEPVKNDPARKYKTVRIPLPTFVSSKLTHIYEESGLKKGCPDLVLWSAENQSIRFVEVKCPHWDAPSKEQERFLEVANSFNVGGKIVEWEFS